MAQSCLPGTDPVGVLQVTVAVIQEHLSFLVALATTQGKSEERAPEPQEPHFPVYPGRTGKHEAGTTYASDLISLLT